MIKFLIFLKSIRDVEPPKSWLNPIIPVCKKYGENYRGINVLNSGCKIYTYIIKNKLYNSYKNKLGEEQNGFIIYIYNGNKSVLNTYTPTRNPICSINTIMGIGTTIMKLNQICNATIFAYFCLHTS